LEDVPMARARRTGRRSFTVLPYICLTLTNNSIRMRLHTPWKLARARHSPIMGKGVDDILQAHLPERMRRRRGAFGRCRNELCHLSNIQNRTDRLEKRDSADAAQEIKKLEQIKEQIENRAVARLVRRMK